MWCSFTTTSSSTATTSTLLYGQPIYPTRPPRPAPKSAGSALLPSKPVPLQHISSWDYEDRIARSDHASASRDGPPPPPRGRRRSRPQLLAMSPTSFADPAAADQLVSQIWDSRAAIRRPRRRLMPIVPHTESASDARNGRYAPERLGGLDLFRAIPPSHVSARSEQRVSIAQTALRLVLWCIYHPYGRRHEHVLVYAASRTESPRRESGLPLLGCHPARNAQLIIRERTFPSSDDKTEHRIFL